MENNEESNTLVNTLFKELSKPEDLNKKQISLFLKQDIINKLDDITKDFNKYTEKSISRNYLLEKAVENLINSYPLVKEKYQEEYEKKKAKIDFNMAVYPSYPGGLETIKKQGKWYYVRINKEYIDKIKYIALYLSSPESQITHYAKVKEYKPVNIDNKTKYEILIDGPIIKLDHPVLLGDTNAFATRSPKYTTLEKLKKAKFWKDL